MVLVITIVDYQAGNVTSVKRALDYLNIPGLISADPKEVERAECIIFPGVGHAGTAMGRLSASGMDQALIAAYHAGVPILGICLGAQIMLTWSEEGDAPCLDLISGETLRMHPPAGFKVPHIGWNTLHVQQEHAVLKGISEESFYFVHAYYMNMDEENSVIATCHHGFEFPVVVGNKNLFATQFHPEKSGAAGLRLLQNFCEWERW